MTNATNTRRGRPMKQIVADVANEIVSVNAGKTLGTIIYLIQRKLESIGETASMVTIRKRISEAMETMKVKAAKPVFKAEAQKVKATINLQTPNVKRAGITNLKEAAQKIVATLKKSGIVRTTEYVSLLLKKMKPGAFTPNPKGRPKKVQILAV